MLRPGRGSRGNEATPARGCRRALARLLDDASRRGRSWSTRRAGLDTDRRPARSITFYDTRDRLLNDGALHLPRAARRGRQRPGHHVEVSTPRSLRGAGPAAWTRVASAEARTKFEEDIKAPFLSLYSFSTRAHDRRGHRRSRRWKTSGGCFPVSPDQDRQVSRHATKLVRGRSLHRARTGADWCEPAGRQDPESGCRVRAHRLV